MSATQLAFGLPLEATAISLVVGAALPDPPPIVVHSLTYRDGVIHQDRTVTADGGLFYATWQAEIIAPDGERVCQGQGPWNYEGGRMVANLPLDVWSGDVGCLERLQRGVAYEPVASWYWGSSQTSKRGAKFIVQSHHGGPNE